MEKRALPPAPPGVRADPRRLNRIAIVHEDDALLVVAKPAGFAVHGGAGEQGPTVLELLQSAYDEPVALHLAHRLDRGTSGVLLLAKSSDALRAIQAHWEQAQKTYLAIALGDYRGPTQIDRPLPDERGVRRPASTRVRQGSFLRSLEPKATLLELSIKSGRTHQIRLHLRDVGHPILFDDRHGDFAANKALAQHLRAHQVRPPRKGELLLHAWRLELPAPLQDAPGTFTAPLPETWRAILAIAGAEPPIPERILPPRAGGDPVGEAG